MTATTDAVTNETSRFTNIDSYQEEIKRFRLPSYGPEAAVFGLLSEAGEVAGVFQKLIRGDYGYTDAQAKLKKELGDGLFHIATIATDNGWTVSELLDDNVEKLDGRLLRGTILGSGDNR
jgi:NTP pyrophosphatase (non-canonical NTP hydrolase)